MSADEQAMAQLAEGFAAMLGPDDLPRPGTPLAAAMDPATNPLAAAKGLSDFVQQYLECDLETANELLERLSEVVEMTASVLDVTDEA